MYDRYPSISGDHNADQVIWNLAKAIWDVVQVC